MPVGTVTTLLATPRKTLLYVKQLAASSDCSTVYVVDGGNHRVQQVDVATGDLSPVAGSGQGKNEDGVGAAASFCAPYGLARSTEHGQTVLYVSEVHGHSIRQITVGADGTGTVSTLAGSAGSCPGTHGSTDGMGTAARFFGPWDAAVRTTRSGAKILYVADRFNGLLRAVQLDGSQRGLVSTVHRANGYGYVTACPDFVFFASDRARGGGMGVYKLDPSTGDTTPATLLAADSSFKGYGTGAIAASADCETVYVGETWGHRVRQVDVSSHAVTTLAGSGANGASDGRGASATFSKHMTGMATCGATLYLAHAVLGDQMERIRAVAIPGPVAARRGG